VKIRFNQSAGSIIEISGNNRQRQLINGGYSTVFLNIQGVD